MAKLSNASSALAARPIHSAFKFGCCLAILWTAGIAKGQVVQVAGERNDVVGGASVQLIGNAATRVSTRPLLFDLPQDSQKSDPSPSDAPNADAQKQENLDAKSQDADKDDKAEGVEAKKQNASRGITPAQNAQLSLVVEPVNIATGTIGTGVLPEDTAAKRALPSSALLDGQARGIAMTQVNWKPANICHLPLYFEDAMLERHGHVRWGHAQPIVSGAKFFATMPLLPYLKTMQPPCEHRYTLGHFRPGSCAPALKDHLPWDRRAAVVETVSLGAFFWAAPL